MGQYISRTEFGYETVKIPVTCPVCGVTNLVDFPALVVTVALTRWNNMRFHSECHDAVWDATSIELSTVRKYLGPFWIKYRQTALSAVVGTAVAAMDSSSAVLKCFLGKPKSITEMSLEDVFASIVIPRLTEAHGRDSCRVRRTSTAAMWHAEPNCGAKLAALLMSSRLKNSCRYINSLLDQGANFNALYHEVFEPAQLHLGKLWDDGRCDDFHLTAGLARLQLEIRRVNATVPAEHVFKPNHSVLLCSQPREPHSVGLCMSSEVFNRRGWDVDCGFPNDDEVLNELLHARWFDVLKVSQSGSLRRDSRLASMRATIDSARSASLNPSLIVMVDGRTFSERPQIYRAVHADAMSASALGAVSVAEQLLAINRSVSALRQVSAL